MYIYFNMMFHEINQPVWGSPIFFNGTPHMVDGF